MLHNSCLLVQRKLPENQIGSNCLDGFAFLIHWRILDWHRNLATPVNSHSDFLRQLADNYFFVLGFGFGCNFDMDNWQNLVEAVDKHVFKVQSWNKDFARDFAPINLNSNHPNMTHSFAVRSFKRLIGQQTYLVYFCFFCPVFSEEYGWNEIFSPQDHLSYNKLIHLSSKI